MKTQTELCGGKVIEDYQNRYCAICGKELHHTVSCRKAEGLACQSHCLHCRHYLESVQRCTFRDKLTGANRTEEKSEQKKKASRANC